MVVIFGWRWIYFLQPTYTHGASPNSHSQCQGPLGVLKLTAAVGAAITSKGGDSLITGELAADLKTVATEVPEALAAHEEAKNLEKKVEKLYEKRDAIVAKALPLVQRGSQSLQGNLGKARLREMGDYGYTVNDTPKPPKA